MGKDYRYMLYAMKPADNRVTPPVDIMLFVGLGPRIKVLKRWKQIKGMSRKAMPPEVQARFIAAQRNVFRMVTLAQCEREIEAYDMMYILRRNYPGLIVEDCRKVLL